MAYKNYIDGRWISCKSRKYFKSMNPANKHVISTHQASDKRDVDLAVKSALKAQKSWSKVPAPKRAEYLFEISRILKRKKHQLGKLVTKEMGKVLSEGLGDVQECIDIFEYMAGEGRRLFGHTTPSELPNKTCYTIRTPIGVAALITPWNFPFAIPGWKLAPALICGNAVIFKPSSDTPLCATRLVEIIEEVGIPKGVVNLVTGPGPDVGSPLIKHLKVHGISFTGSKSTGEFITKNAGLKKVGLELGGKNAIIVMDDADLDLAVDGILWGAFGTTGQRCTASSRVIAHKKIKKELEEKLLKRTLRLKLGDGLKSSTSVGPLINQSAVEKSERYCKIGKKEHAKMLCGGSAPENLKGFFFKPTIFTNVKPNMTIAQEEIFGPVVSIIKAENFKDAVKICNGIEYGLSSAIYTNNISYEHLAAQLLETGITYINSSTIGAEVHLPFGGVKGTGHTREAGQAGLEEFSHIKTIYIDYSNRLQKAQGID
jgi:alpha-ketoglutaric semialdehyde dehydrogenase